MKHGLAYERSHDIDHTIKDLIRPHSYDKFLIDAEEEHYGDSGDEKKPHLNLHPKKHEFEPRVIKPEDHTHFFAGKHSMKVPSLKEVLPEGSDHWVEVHREKGGHRSHRVAPYHVREQHHEPAHVKKVVKPVLHHREEPKRDYIEYIEAEDDSYRHAVHEEPTYVVHEAPRHVVYEEPRHVVYEQPHRVVYEEPRHVVHEERRHVVYEEPSHEVRHVEYEEPDRRVVYE